MELTQLLKRCREGNELAWELLVRQFQARVYGIAFHYVGNREDARDIAQEVFVRIYSNLEMCKGAEMFLPWMIRITRNACIDSLRRKSVRPEGEFDSGEPFQQIAAQDANPEELWATESRKRLIHRALQELTDTNREMILLKDIQGLPFEEIADLLGIPLGTAKSRSNRARIELAEKVMALSGPVAGNCAS